LFKESYVFNFLDRENIRTEEDLKRQMINHILDLLEEFGKGFALVGKEYKLTTPTNKEFKIDLLLYHTKIHAYIVIEVKLGEFNGFIQILF
jgi:predicted nuclease of restriction endonuclease-like (RecB) superfamily